MKQLTVFTLAGLLLGHLAYGQGTVYVSNLQEATFTTEHVASDWTFAAFFVTGNHPEGYDLNSLQLLLSQGSGAPYGFHVSIHGVADGLPGVSLGALAGPDPYTGGAFSYVATGVTLASSTPYFIVVTAANPLAEGHYNWNRSTTSDYQTSGGWFSSHGYYYTHDGATWFVDRNSPLQFAVAATPIPEPSSFALLLCGGALIAGYRCRTATRVLKGPGGG
jgi:hypothetical protein